MDGEQTEVECSRDLSSNHGGFDGMCSQSTIIFIILVVVVVVIIIIVIIVVISSSPHLIIAQPLRHLATPYFWTRNLGRMHS